MQCTECGKPVSLDELALSKKLISRALSDGYCLACLAKKFDVSQDLLRQKIEQYKQAGCGLFSVR